MSNDDRDLLNYLRGVIKHFQIVLKMAGGRKQTAKAKSVKYHVDFILHRLNASYNVVENGGSDASIAVGDILIFKSMYEPLKDFWMNQVK